ncbi:hypothetical protein N8I71_05990 [Roseibacterium sp. SDUM158016]|jgi:hypothetical protein|uniref:hypothetical protein n=1 Tax=Roseicyclus sediminis TaxID=2980997 RepID=UPI0021D16E98|nr:hypothetical protein [Roseibacterium sp. SDUM158016]MCU4652372.1 hypothetical protein [Roseibacterium sp. SDUM158016]
MSEETLVRLTLREGRYEGELTAAHDTGIEAVHEGRVVAAARLVRERGEDAPVRVSLDLPAEVLSDGVQVVALRSTVTGSVLDRVTFLAGDALEEDLRAEIALLRDELEMLKTAFRRHVSAQER